MSKPRPEELKFSEIRTMLVLNGNPMTKDSIESSIAVRFKKQYKEGVISGTVDRLRSQKLIEVVSDPELEEPGYRLTKDGRGIQKLLESNPDFVRQSTSPNV